MPETSRREERGQRNGSGSFGHGRHSDRSLLPRRISLPANATELPKLDTVFWRVLDDGLAEAGFELPAAARAAIDGHVRLLVAWNAQINLTALRSSEQIARNHVLDSLICVDALGALARNVGSILDIGTGGGFPALPLAAVLRPRRVALVESIGKKARFLDVAAREIQRALAADGTPDVTEIKVFAQRAEDLADDADQRERWHLVTARAVGTLSEVAELGLPLTRTGGHVVTWKRDAGDGSLAREIGAARRISQACGGAAPRVIRLDAAARVGLDGHCLVAIRKVRPTPDRYPREPSERHRSR